jgi:hypothetical protein
MSTIAQVSQAMQTVLTTAAEAADARLHYTKRPDRAKFSASTLVQTLVFGWLAHPDATIEQLSQTAARVGVEVSPQAIDQRFTLATATLLQTVLTSAVQQAISGDAVALPLLQRFTGVRVHDGTTISLPDGLAEHWAGCGGRSHVGTSAALKCGVQLDLLTGALTALDLVSGRTHDSSLPCQHTAQPPGSLRLADLGFYDLQRLAELDRSQVYFLSKLRPNARVRAPDLAGLDLATFVTHHAATGYDGWVQIGKDHPLRARLLVQPVPQEVADQRRRRIRKEAREKGQTASAAALLLAAWTILITNAPRRLLTLAEALVLARVRWQIELIFKLWKSHGQIDQWRSERPERILCEVYAKLLAMVLQQWLLIVGCWAYADRSLTKAAQVIRDHAIELATAQARPERLDEVITTIQRVLKRTARMNTRSKHPNTYQLVLALTTTDEEA